MLVQRTFSTSYVSPLSVLFRSQWPQKTPLAAVAVLKSGLATRIPSAQSFHTSHPSRQQSQTTKLSASSPTTPGPGSPVSTPPASPYANLAEYIPEYAKLNPDEKLSTITSLRAGITAADPKTVDKERMKRALEDLDEEEKRVKAGDNLFYKAFRTIAWGPTIAFNLVLALIFG